MASRPDLGDAGRGRLIDDFGINLRMRQSIEFAQWFCSSCGRHERGSLSRKLDVASCESTVRYRVEHIKVIDSHRQANYSRIVTAELLLEKTGSAREQRIMSVVSCGLSPAEQHTPGTCVHT